MKFCVMSRVRPINYGIEHIKCDVSQNNMIVNEIKKDLMNKESINPKEYIFDKVYDKNYNNDDLFNDFGMEIAENIIKKIDTTFYVYGQTGSGKTHTIMGTDEIPGLLTLILNFVKTYQNIKLTFNSIQIYNNKCYDILNNNNEIYEREDAYGKVNLTNIKSITLNNNISNIIDLIKKNRVVGKSGQNDASSRSHLLFQINNGNNFLKILDLAGSERASVSVYINKDVFRENAEINQSILNLKECIRGLKNNNAHIPYRGSKLTRILKDSFERRTENYILATVSPEKENIADSINTLNYISDFQIIKKKPTVKLPRIQTNLNNKPGNILNNKYDLSPNFKLLMNNRNELDINNKNKNKLFNYITRNKTTYKYKTQILEYIDKEIKLLLDIKNNLN